MPFGEYDSSNNSMDLLGMEFKSSEFDDMKDESQLTEDQRRKLEEERIKEQKYAKVKKAGWIILFIVIGVLFTFSLITYLAWKVL